MKNNVIFDLDGTLLDTTDGVIESVKYAIHAMGFKELPYVQLLSFVGPPIQDSFSKHYKCNDKSAQVAAEYFRNYYKTKALFKAIPYIGIFDVIRQLKSMEYKIAVATYKREDYAINILEHFGFSIYCNTIHGADNLNKLLKTDIINICIDELGGNRENTVLVGDTSYDAIGAQEAGVDFIGVTYGFGFKCICDVNKYKNIGCVDKTVDILKVLKSI